jgi:hypothetical protein
MSTFFDLGIKWTNVGTFDQYFCSYTAAPRQGRGWGKGEGCIILYDRSPYRNHVSNKHIFIELYSLFLILKNMFRLLAVLQNRMCALAV